jgi:acetate kinase
MKILVVNCGSSSLKYELFAMPAERSLARGVVERIGPALPEPARLRHEVVGGPTVERIVDVTDHAAALDQVCTVLTDPRHGVLESPDEIAAVGHRVVHGGEAFAASVRIDAAVLAAIQACSHLAPLHNPPNLRGIAACLERWPTRPQVAVFDTAFHRSLPAHAYTYALPQEVCAAHAVRRYGFHGTSHRYVADCAAQRLEAAGLPRPQQRLITGHLGNGCSMAAVQGGQCRDTSMGFTPLEGLVMGTRAGDLDPAVLLYLSERHRATPAELDDLLNKRSGLLGLSGLSSDVRDLLAAAQQGHRRARLALDVFCYRVRKYIGAYTAALGGLDALIFTGGIGETSAPLRAQICHSLAFLGLAVDPARNADPPPDGDISDPSAAARIFVIPTHEELLIARDTAGVVAESEAARQAARPLGEG